MMRTAFTCHSGGFFGSSLQGSAGGVDAVVKDGEVAVGALGAGGRHAGLVGGVQTQRVDEPVAIVVRQVHDGAVGDLAVLFGEPDVAFGVQALGGLVVDHPVGFERRVAIIDLHVADGGDAVIDVVVVDLVRLHEHLLLLAGFVARDGNLAILAASAGWAGN